MKKNNLLLALTALFSLGLSSCGVLEAEDPSESVATSVQPSTPAGDTSTPQETSTPEQTNGYSFNTITEATNLYVAIFDKYVEAAPAEGASYAKDYADKIISDYIATLPENSGVVVGVVHFDSSSVAAFGAAVNEYGKIDVIIGSGANIYTTGLVTSETNNEKSALTAEIATAQTGRQAALLINNEKAIALYNYLTGSTYEPAIVDPQPSESTPETSEPETSEPEVSEPEVSESTPEALPELTYDINTIDGDTNLIVGIWDAYVETLDGETYSTTYTEEIIKKFVASLPTDTTIKVGVVHFSEAKVAAFGSAVNTDGRIDVIIGSGANIYSTGLVTYTTGVEGGVKAALTAEIVTFKEGRQAALLNNEENAVALYNFLTGTSYVPAE